MITLTTSPQTIFTTALGFGGTTTLTFQVPMPGHAWAAGNYTTSLIYSMAGGTVTNPGLLTITIPAFMTVPAALPTFTLNVNNLTYYASSTVSASAPMAISASVPYQIAVKANNSSLSYSNTLGMSTPSNLTLSNVSASLNGGTSVALSGTSQNLNSTPVAVSAGNNQTSTIAFSIAPAALVSQFVQAGTYTVPLTFTTSNPGALAANQATTSTLTVNVADMQSFVVNNATTTLTLAATSDYAGGVSSSLPNHLTVSSTTPWNVSVRVSGTPSNGTTSLPAGLVSVGNTSGQSILTSRTLTITDQTLTTTSQAAAIAKTVGVLYSISAANAASLISKATKANDVYSATVTYTLSAL